MATNIDKGLYAAPTGLAAAAADGPDIEIEVVIEGEEGPDEDDADDASETEFNENLAEKLDDSYLGSLATTLKHDTDNDQLSRADWEKTYKEGLKLLGLKYEERTEPWDGACGVTHPMITEAVVRFQSETIMETFPAKGPVMTKIMGKETREKKEAAERVRDDMNYQLTERMIEYRPEHEKMLWSLPAVGSAFKKVYYDPSLGRQVSLFIPAEDILLPYGASDIYSADRVTHEMRKSKDDLIRLQKAGFYRDASLGTEGVVMDEVKQAKDKETGFTDTYDNRYVLREIHANLIIEGDPLGDAEVARPYVVTMLRDTQVILSIRRNWHENDPHYLRRQHFVQYDYVPGFGPYGYGLFHLIGGYAKSSTSILRQLVDSGTLANLPGGLKTRGLRIKGDDTPIGPGEFRDVDVAGGTIKDNIMPLPYKEPSAVLAGLLDKIIEEGRRLPGIADLKVGDMSSQAPVGTTLALLERQLKVMTAVQARVHFSLKQELKLLKAIIADYAEEDYSYETTADVPRARRADFSLVEVIPVSDPNAATLSQRVVQYQAVIQLSQTAPEVYDLPQLHRGMLEVLGIKNADKLVPLAEDIKPTDPVTENMLILKGEPVKAFQHQDHEAHIAVHTAAMQDPMLMQLMGQNPKAQVLLGAAQAHIAEHAGYLYRSKIEARLGMALPPMDEELPPEVETALSAMMAQAAQQVLQAHQQQAAAQQAQQQAQDPVLQLQMAEVEIKKSKTDAEIEDMRERRRLDEQRLQIEAAGKADKQELDQQRLQVDAAAKADAQELAEKKQRDDAELREHELQVSAAKVGVMGRAQDQTILEQDRRYALDQQQGLEKAHKTNEAGESGKKAKKPAKE